jgi:hypothetical protein
VNLLGHCRLGRRLSQVTNLRQAGMQKGAPACAFHACGPANEEGESDFSATLHGPEKGRDVADVLPSDPQCEILVLKMTPAVTLSGAVSQLSWPRAFSEESPCRESRDSSLRWPDCRRSGKGPLRMTFFTRRGAAPGM